MKLPRPHISMEARCRVALRQFGTFRPDDAIDARKRTSGGLSKYLMELLDRLADLLGCEVRELRLDHVPALALRDKVFSDGIHVDYDPPCDSVDDLIYRTYAAHLVKTNHHGDGAQHPDRVLIKRERRRERRAAACKEPAKKASKLAKKTNWPKRSFPKKRKQ